MWRVYIWTVNVSKILNLYGGIHSMAIILKQWRFIINTKKYVSPFSPRDNYRDKFWVDNGDECFQMTILSLFLSSSLKNRITEHYPDSQVISQQELRIRRICCTFSINIVDVVLTIVTVLQFCKLRYKMVVKTYQSFCFILCQGTRKLPGE